MRQMCELALLAGRGGAGADANGGAKLGVLLAVKQLCGYAPSELPRLTIHCQSGANVERHPAYPVIYRRTQATIPFNAPPVVWELEIPDLICSRQTGVAANCVAMAVLPVAARQWLEHRFKTAPKRY